MIEWICITFYIQWHDKKEDKSLWIHNHNQLQQNKRDILIIQVNKLIQ